MADPTISKEDFRRLFEEYAACVNIEVDEELEAWGIEWEGLHEAIEFFCMRMAEVIYKRETPPSMALQTIAYVFFALGVKCSMELELRRQAAQ